MKALIGMFILLGVFNSYAQTNAKAAAPKKYDHSHNSNWQAEVGFNIYKDILSSGAASINNIFNLDPQKLVSSDTGITLGIRKNFDLANTFYASIGASLSLSSHEHVNNVSTTQSIQRESEVRVIIIEQRFGFSYQLYQNGIYNLILRPFVGFGFNMQQTETTTRVSNSGSLFGERPTNTINDFFFTPTFGADLLITQSWGVQAKYTQSQINTPSTNLVEGPTRIGEGFDQIHIFTIAAIYSF